MKRRDFISNISKTAISATTYSSLNPVFAIPNLHTKPKKLLVIKVVEGMDTLMGLNPWIKSRPSNENLFIDENYDVFRSIKGSEINLGPSASALKSFTDDFSIINGIFMGTSDVGHEAARNYLSMGGVDNRSDFSATLAASLSPRRKTKVITNESVQAGYYEKYLDVRNTEEIFSNNQHQDFSHINFSQNSPFSSAVKSLFRPKESSGKQFYDQIISSLETDYSDKLNDTDMSVIAGLLSNVATFAQIEMETESDIILDSHDDYENNHQESQKSIWDKIATYLEVLKNKGNNFEDLTIVVLNDFSRLPFLNLSKGKDHNFFENSVLVAGENIRGGLVVGSTTLIDKNASRANSQRSGIPYDYKLQKSVNLKEDLDAQRTAKYYQEHKDIDMIRPHNVWATISKSLGVDISKMPELPNKAKTLDRLILD